MRVVDYLGALFMGILLVSAASAAAQEALAPDPEFDELLALNISELTVTSVSLRPQKMNKAAAAVYVITQEDLRRRGITSIPEALRLVPGVHVAQVGSNRWAVSARGFHNTLSNKLLVLIDGRSIYTPVFSGTYWDDKTTLIENIDRIEVIRGPGGTLWGANAVNGVINIITKSARETHGEHYASAGAGTDEHFVEGQTGGIAGSEDYYHTYAQYFGRGSSEDPSGFDNPDAWYRARSGFRMDGALSGQDDYIFQGSAYTGEQDARTVAPLPVAPFSETIISRNDSFGGNLMARWNREISSASDLSLLGYIDHYTRHEATSSQNITTANMDFQHHQELNARNNFIWGLGMRAYRYEVEGSFTVRVNQEATGHGTLSAFAQNEYAMIPDILYLTVGSKLEYNDLTGVEVQPNVRASWYPNDRQTVWAAISRAVRTPSVIEEDIDIAAQVQPGPPVTVLRAVGNPDQESEEVIAYELGHRIQPMDKLSFDTAVFYNRYDKLATFSNPGAAFIDEGGLLTVPFPLSNLGSGHVYGVEEAVTWNVTDRWSLQASYTYLRMYLDVEPGAFLSLEATEEGVPRNQFAVSSYLDVTDNVQWNNVLYYVDDITAPVEAYIRFDTHLNWRLSETMELGLTGRNLLDDAHPEFSASPQAEIGRSVLARVIWRF